MSRKSILKHGVIVNIFKILGDSGQRAVPSGNVLWKVQCTVCDRVLLLPYRYIKKYKSCGCNRGDILSSSMRKSLNRGGCGDIYATHWNMIKKNAISRGLSFNISVDFAWKLFLKQDRKCALTGIPLHFSTRCWSKDSNASLDRVDSSKGYIKGNLQWVHKNVNMMKQQYSTELFLYLCKKVVDYNKDTVDNLTEEVVPEFLISNWIFGK